MTDGSGTLTITGNRFDKPSDDSFIVMENKDVNATVNAIGNTFSNDSVVGVELFPVNAVGTSALDLTFKDNTAIGSQAYPFSRGLSCTSMNNGSCKVTVVGNEFSGFEGYAIGVFAFLIDTGATNSGTVSDNTISDAGSGVSLLVRTGTDTLTVSGNTIINSKLEGISALFSGASTLLVENNNVSNSGNRAVAIGSTVYAADAKIALRSNSFSGSGGVDVEVYGANGGTRCLDIISNTFSKNLYLQNEGLESFTVERFDQGLDSFNTFNGTRACGHSAFGHQTCSFSTS
ncbi:MAG: right-handed parallel beta-helix repeat-containing protein [Vulcanimicrobiota bacterium]